MIVDDEYKVYQDRNVINGIGSIDITIELEGIEDRIAVPVTDGQCDWCGYDRGVVHTHTEVRGYTINCRECGRELDREDE